MTNNFDIHYLPQAKKFLKRIDRKAATAILRDMEVARKVQNARFFKKLNPLVWEFRTKHSGSLYRTLAFWDKEEKSLVVATHGFIKKDQRTPAREIKKAEQLMKRYYDEK